MSVLSSGGSECHDTGRSRRKRANTASLSSSDRSQNSPWPRSTSSSARSVVGVGTGGGGIQRCYDGAGEDAAGLVGHDRIERARDRAHRFEPPPGDDAIGAGRLARRARQPVGYRREELELALSEWREQLTATRAEHELREELASHITWMLDRLAEPARDATFARA